MGSWSYLCRKHFDSEKKKWWFRRTRAWCGVDDDCWEECDVKGCGNKAYREVYTTGFVINWCNKFTARVLNALDFRYWNCKCHYEIKRGLLTDLYCEKHGGILDERL